MTVQDLPQGVGLGLRFSHFESILSDQCRTPWFEVIADDFLIEGPHHQKLEQLRQDKPIVFQSTGLNIGGVDPFNFEYLKKFKHLYQKYQPSWISDHLCWSAHNGAYHHDLLPIPKTNEGLNRVVSRVNKLQDYFGRELCLENITSYIDYRKEDFDEIDFITEVVNRTGCRLLFDLSNVLINHKNRGLSPNTYLERYPYTHVQQVHLSGGSLVNNIIVDTHAEGVGSKDMQVLSTIQSKHQLNAPIMIERDANLPSFEALESERTQISRAWYAGL